MSDTVVPVAWMHEDNLTSLKTGDGIVIATLSRNHYGAIKAAPLYSEATVTALQSRIAELEKDAARYRWLRNQLADYDVRRLVAQSTDGHKPDERESLLTDEAIDAAMAASK